MIFEDIQFIKVVIGKGADIAVSSVIFPGVNIGEYS
jgi:acetyltransferase-like isoleucine patch superfamily enzyme